MKKFIISADLNPNGGLGNQLALHPSEMGEETFELLMNYLKLNNMEYFARFQGENFKSLSFDNGMFKVYVFEA